MGTFYHKILNQRIHLKAWVEWEFDKMWIEIQKIRAMDEISCIFYIGQEEKGGKWGHLAEDERLSFLGTFLCAVLENR